MVKTVLKVLFLHLKSFPWLNYNQKIAIKDIFSCQTFSLQSNFHLPIHLEEIYIETTYVKVGQQYPLKILMLCQALWNKHKYIFGSGFFKHLNCIDDKI